MKIDRRRLAENAAAPVGIVDIGSNSVRLVVFAGASRNPVTLFNERMLAGLGRNLATTGHLNREGVERALRALARYRAVAHSLGAARLVAVATAAVREASDGPDFVQRARHACGTDIRVLSGKEEARFTALGVLCGMPDAHGLVGDLGGGSLEVLSIDQGKIGQGATIPVGGLRLMDLSAGDIGKARRITGDALQRASWISQVTGNFYAVGGAWRVLARIHMAQHGYDLHVLQNYIIDRKDALELAHLIAGQSTKSLRKIPKISCSRLESLPFSAVVLERLLTLSPVEKVVISAFGLREGLLYDGFSDALKAYDPLIHSCTEISERLSRSPAFNFELIQWTKKILDQVDENEETGQLARMREAICLLSDIEWRSHPDHRGENAFQEVLFGPLGSVTHAERYFIALGVFHRYEAKGSVVSGVVLPVISHEWRNRARLIGLLVRLGATVTGGAVGIIRHVSLERGDKLVLTIPGTHADLVGEAVEKRLEPVARALGLVAEIQVRV